MKKLLYALLLLPLLATSQPTMQSQLVDSLWQVWQDESRVDSIRLFALDKFIWNGYLFTQPDSAFYYAQLEYDFARSKGLKTEMADALNVQGISFAIRANYDRAIDYFMQSLKIKEETGDQMGVANLLNNIGIIYQDRGEYTKAIDNYKLSLKIQEEIENDKGVANSFNNIGNCYYNQNEFIKAIDYHSRSLKIKEELVDKKGISESLNNIGLVYKKQGNYSKALDAFNRSLQIKEEFGDKQSIANSLNNIGEVFLAQGEYTAALEYSRRALKIADEVGVVKQTRDAAETLWKVNKKIGNYKSGLEMYELYIQFRDSILSEENEKEVIRQEYKYAYEKQAAADSTANAKASEIQNAQIAQQQAEIKAKKNQQYGLWIVLLLMIALAASAYYRFQSKKKAHELLQKTLADLKSTQAQLIQSEKMASLGELTAGIAHEIRNPLNFVNNFSELNTEMLSELQEELANGNFKEVVAIANNLSENEAKITHHGKRADAIVKGMLAHSRSGKGEKAPTDLNTLAEEYLKLSYHGLRARDKIFNADFKTDFDPNLPEVNIVPQDIGRVLLNLINNAFQAVNEKSKKGDSNYLPTVTITTKLTANGQQLIAISDNGPGIPESIKDKIFQPFFTTKPTGQGTGLGLSLSYDIMKAHGGELTVDSKPGSTEFRILIPLEKS